MEIKDVILDIEKISNLIEIGNVGGRDMGQVDCVKELEKVSNFDDFLSIIKTLTRLRNVAGDIELIEQTVRQKDFLIITNNFFETADIVKKIISCMNKNLTFIKIIQEDVKTAIEIPSKLPYRITISHDLDKIRGINFDGIYFDISLSSKKFKKAKELYPQTKIKYYGIEDFVQRKMSEEQYKDGLSFGRAIDYLKKGKKVAREGWKNDDVFICYVPKTIYITKTSLEKGEFDKTSECNGYMVLKVRDNDVLAWTPSTDDCLANDWFVVE